MFNSLFHKGLQQFISFSSNYFVVISIALFMTPGLLHGQDGNVKPKGFTICQQKVADHPMAMLTIPPSMSIAKRDSMDEPSANLVIWNTTLDKAQYYDGKGWKSFKSNQHYIGQEFGGGIVFHTDATFEHGMIMAHHNLPQKVKWGGQDSLTSANAKGMGKGQSNTDKIIKTLGQAENAARLCYDLELNGFSDWYLPSIDELNQLFQSIYLKHAGNFEDGQYWSSTETDFNNAWILDFKYKTPSESNIRNILFVRPVRSF